VNVNAVAMLTPPTPFGFGNSIAEITPLMQLETSPSTPDAVVFALSGDMDLEHVARLQELLASETVNRLTLDLKEVTFADRAAVQFLASAEASGIRIVNCPRYVRSWITAEAENQPQRIEEQDK